MLTKQTGQIIAVLRVRSTRFTNHELTTNHPRTSVDQIPEVESVELPHPRRLWISLSHALGRTEGVEKAEAILLRAQAIHPEVAMIAFNLACYASVAGRMEEAKERLRHAIELDKEARKLALEDEDLRPLWDWIGGLK
jgi:hypothetical protein